MSRDDEFVTEGELEEMLGELEQAVAKLEWQAAEAADRRARGDATVMADIARRLDTVEKNAAIGLAQQAPRARRAQRERARPAPTVESLNKLADKSQDDHDHELAAGYRAWAQELEGRCP
jgi:hypothetical protein